MSEKWHDLFRDGQRLDRVIRRLEKRFKKTEEDEKIIKLANSITYVTSKKMELANMVLGVVAIVKSEGKKSSYAENYKTVYPEKP